MIVHMSESETPPTRPVLLSPQQVADRLSISRQTVLRLISQGKLRAARITPRTLRIREDDLADIAGAYRESES